MYQLVVYTPRKLAQSHKNISEVRKRKGDAARDTKVYLSDLAGLIETKSLVENSDDLAESRIVAPWSASEACAEREIDDATGDQFDSDDDKDRDR